MRAQVRWPGEERREGLERRAKRETRSRQKKHHFFFYAPPASASSSSLITAAVSHAPARRPLAPRCMRKVSATRAPAGPASTATSTHPAPSSGRTAAAGGSTSSPATTVGGQAVPGGGSNSGKEVAKVATKWS